MESDPIDSGPLHCAYPEWLLPVNRNLSLFAAITVPKFSVAKIIIAVTWTTAGRMHQT